MNELVNVFAGNPLLAEKRSHVNPQALHDLLQDEVLKAKGGARLLPIYESKVLIVSSLSPEGSISWALFWQLLDDFGTKVAISLSSVSNGAEVLEEKGELMNYPSKEYDKLVYVGEKEGIPYFAIDVSSSGVEGRGKAESVAAMFPTSDGNSRVSFVDVRTLLIAADWDRKPAMEELSIAGYARAMTEWHKTTQYCGRCGSKTVPIEAGGRRECSNPACKSKSYPRTDPVVIMLIIDKERDRVVLGRSNRHPPRTWSCLAGFIEVGESLEEAVRRETLEEVGLQVGEVIYHSSQPWPLGPGGMSSQLMVGFMAYAKTFDIYLDGAELADARWYSREEVKQAMDYVSYRAQREASLLKIWQQGLGGEREKPDSVREKGNSGIIVPGPYAIAHNLIATWANRSAL